MPREGAARRTAILWAVLFLLSAVLALVLEVLHVPAAFLLGPMAAAIVIAVMQGPLPMGRSPFVVAQGVIGCMIAHSLTPSTLGTMLQNGPLFLAATLGVVAAAGFIGWLLARWRVLPGTTAVWGAFPGAASAMVLMAEAHGADVRLVAFMQYLRVLCVAVGASTISGIWVKMSGGTTPHVVWFAPIHWLPFAETLALAVLGAIVSYYLRVPAGPLLLPMALGAVLQAFGAITIELPPWLLAMSYTLLGWSIGMRFTPSILAHAARALPPVIASIVALMAVGGFLAYLLAALADIDPLTAYLATSPGGADSVAIIAASAKVNVPFVMGLQIARFLLVLIAGPVLARRIAGWTGVAEEKPPT